MFEIDKQIYLIIYDQNEDEVLVNKYLTDKFDIWIGYDNPLVFCYVNNYEGYYQAFRIYMKYDGSFSRSSLLFEDTEVWNSNKRYPVIWYNDFYCFTYDINKNDDN